MKRSIALVVVVAATAVLAVTAATGGTSKSRLIGTVGKNNSFTITLADSSGRRVRSLEAGTYTIVVRDASRIHNFELEREHNGRDWDVTNVGFVGTKTIRLKLTPGEYKVYCGPHEAMMFQKFTVR
jgi:plastocyanin